MTPTTKTLLSTAKRRPLAACCAVLFSLAAPEVFAANTWQVSNCNDSGAGSLRDIVANVAASGDIVDFSQLNLSNCPSSTISLTTGAIVIAQDSLTLQGHAQAITGYYNGAYQNDRVLTHTGSGTLTVKALLIEYNHFYPNGPAKGGCIYSSGNVILDHTELFKCTAKPANPGSDPSAIALGGGVFAHGSLSLKYSEIRANSAKTLGASDGGGVATDASFSISSTTIDSNYSKGQAGGVFSRHGGSITASTISRNTAADASGSLGAGGVFVNGTGTDTLQIVNSTISGNNAANAVVGGVVSEIPTSVQNSTIAFNKASRGRLPKSGGGFYYFSVGLHVVASGHNSPLTLQSSILSNNTYGTTERDFSAQTFAPYTVAITSDHNIIRASSGPQQPPTVTTACPLLAPLHPNGGPTFTHMLLSRSPAIDAGSNPLNLATDQNINNRVSGAAIDIGATEVQQGETIFNASFEGCP